MIFCYSISELRPLIAWAYFDWAWGISGKPGQEREELHREAETMLDSWEGKYSAKAILLKLPCNADGDNIVIGENREFCIPMLRQQKPESPINEDGTTDNQVAKNVCLSLADYIRPLSHGKQDEIGIFCTTMDADIDTCYAEDPYQRMLAQTLADRLAEATAEKLSEMMPGIRPAVGYPSMPDMSVNFILDEIMDMKQAGITLTTSGMMQPHASVSGLIFSNPSARYFNISAIGEDQIREYAQRRRMTFEEMKRYIKL